MTRKAAALTAAVAIAFAAPAFATSQLIASAGLTPQEAAGMTLAEIAQHKFNQGVSYSDRMSVSVPKVEGNADRSQLIASAGLTPEEARGLTAAQVAAVKTNRDQSYADRQSVGKRSGVTMASRSVATQNDAWRQLIASAGLSSREAEDLTLNEIAAAKYNRDHSYADRQRVR
jgi:hypothetical protein